MPRQPLDRNGKLVSVGSLVRVLKLSGAWFEQLPIDEKPRVESMIGEVFSVEEIDEYGQPWVRKSWPNEAEGTCNSHAVALEPEEMELINVRCPSNFAFQAAALMPPLRAERCTR
jgi:hypothetical protein